MARELDLQTLTLASGGHDPDSGQMCVMEAVAYMAGEPWSDMPQCASPVIAAFCRAWNDTDGPYGEAIRARLRDYIPRLVNSRGTREQEDARAWLATDWLIRVQAPAWMRLAPALVPHAEVLAALPPQTSAAAVRASAAAWDAASAAAWDAARRAAASAALQPAVEELQASAWTLLDKMLDVSSESEQ